MSCIMRCNNSEQEVVIDEQTGLPVKNHDYCRRSVAIMYFVCSFTEKPSVIYKPSTIVPQNTILEIPPPKELETPITFNPTVDTFFDADTNKIVVLMELPGFSHNDITVECGLGELIISGPRPKDELYEKFGNNLDIHIRERKVGYFYRRFKLPHNALDKSVAVSYSNGILDIRVECSQFSEMRRIQIDGKA
ncbi:small heat shock protein, putative [Babesia bigemina]|uniref:Small heat shock protein, putative n=1 Tax=Babesia bigemina TaxID=5866 RepID=A0A061D3Y6_BABBI|nr:small heat shock protein, putative [Babesia bigemina]CDR95278.1 small heat shock protein, putative [Babesia bigemina]|eukprot:XP_012767464.1 small heat shock protein, putative [Babesia bigemina]